MDNEDAVLIPQFPRENLSDVVASSELFNDYSTAYFKKYFENLTQRDIEVPLSWDVEEARKDLYLKELGEDTEEIFDYLVEGELNNLYQVKRIFEITAEEEKLREMTIEELRILTMRRMALSVGVKIFLARLFRVRNNKAMENVGDICAKYWHEFGSAMILRYAVAKDVLSEDDLVIIINYFEDKNVDIYC